MVNKYRIQTKTLKDGVIEYYAQVKVKRLFWHVWKYITYKGEECPLDLNTFDRENALERISKHKKRLSKKHIEFEQIEFEYID